RRCRRSSRRTRTPSSRRAPAKERLRGGSESETSGGSSTSGHAPTATSEGLCIDLRRLSHYWRPIEPTERAPTRAYRSARSVGQRRADAQLADLEVARRRPVQGRRVVG